MHKNNLYELYIRQAVIRHKLSVKCDYMTCMHVKIKKWQGIGNIILTRDVTRVGI